MDKLDVFLKSVDSKIKPEGLNLTEKCLWTAGTGEWEKAHDMVQDVPDPYGSWIHAMLHREEGDLSNASYWYHMAGKPMPAISVSIMGEWKSISTAYFA